MLRDSGTRVTTPHVNVTYLEAFMTQLDYIKSECLFKVPIDFHRHRRL